MFIYYDFSSLVIKKNNEKYNKISANYLEEIAKTKNKMKLNILEPGIKFPNNDLLLVKPSKHLVIEDKKVYLYINKSH